MADHKQSAVSAFIDARRYYEEGRFLQARKKSLEYQKLIDYLSFSISDRRHYTRPKCTVIIVIYNTDIDILGCLAAIQLQADEQQAEIIVVDNGGNSKLEKEILMFPLMYVRCPHNFLPSEGRNIGAYFARGSILLFVDDDGVPGDDYLYQAMTSLDPVSVIGIRGRIVPLRAEKFASPHYNLGEYPRAASFNLEGNMAIKRSIFRSVGGFDPLMFGHEGRELANRCRSSYPEGLILYIPGLVLRHDFAEGQHLLAKRLRQSIGESYLEYLSSTRVNGDNSMKRNLGPRLDQPGLSVVIRSNGENDDIEGLLLKISSINTFKPLQITLVITEYRKYHAELAVKYYDCSLKVLPGKNRSLSSVAKRVAYENILVLSSGSSFKTDCFDEIHHIAESSTGKIFVVPKSGISDAFVISRSFALETNHLSVHASVDEIFKLYPSSETSTSDCINEEPVLRIGYFRSVKSNPPNDYEEIALSQEIKPLVTFIIPIFNKKEHLKKCLDSFLSIDEYIFEIVCVDDCSDDGSEKIVRDYSFLSNNITLLRSKINRGASSARNTAIEYSKGKYLAFVDADDQYHVDAISPIVNELEAEKWDVVRGKIQGVSYEGKTVNLAKQKMLHSSNHLVESWLEEESLWFHWYFTAGLYNRVFLKENTIKFPEGIRNEDPYFLCRVFMAASSIQLIDGIFYSYLVEPTNLKRSTASNFFIGWSKGYYKIYQLMQAYEKQSQYFLCHFPSLYQHSKNLVRQNKEGFSKEMLKYIILMFKNLNADYMSSPSSQPWIHRRSFSKEEKSYIDIIKSDNVNYVYSFLLEKVRQEELQ